MILREEYTLKKRPLRTHALAAPRSEVLVVPQRLVARVLFR